MTAPYFVIYSGGTHTVRSTDAVAATMFAGSNLAVDDVLPVTVDCLAPGANYTASELFMKFDTSVVSGNKTASSLVLPSNGSSTNYHLALYQYDWSTVQTSNFRTAAQLTALTPLDADFTVQTGDYNQDVAISASIPWQTNYGLVIAYRSFESSGTTSGQAIIDGDPSLIIQTDAGTAWTLVNVGTEADTGGATLTMNMPTGTQSGDLLVACICYRSLSTTDITLPDGWTRGPQQKNANEDVNATTGVSSGLIAWIVRGASTPALAFGVPDDTSNVAHGVILAYRGAHQLAPLVASDGATNNGAASTDQGAPSITTPVHNTLLVYLGAGARQSTSSGAYAESLPNIASGNTNVIDPSPVRWDQLLDSDFTTGCDGAIAIAHTVMTNPGSTGAFHYAAGSAAHHVGLVAAFRLAIEVLAGASAAVPAPVLGAPTLQLGIADLTASNISVPAPAVAAAAMDQAQLLDLWLNDRVVQYGMDVFADVDTIAILSDAPKNWWQASTGYKLGTKSVGFGDITFDADGGKVATAAITQGTVNAAGQGKVWAALDTLQSRIIAYGNLSAPVAMTTGKYWSLDAVEIVMPRSPA